MPDTIDPFDRDVDAHGAYVYTDMRRKSCVCANERFTQVILQESQPQGKRVVDIGCGDGTYTEPLLTRGGSSFVLGIDPAGKAIARAQSRYGSLPRLEFRAASAADLKAEGALFDLAVVRGVIHHVGDPGAEVAAVLSIAKQAFFLEPNGWNPALKVIEKVSRYHREHSERSYRVQLLHQWIEAAGGTVERTVFFGLVPMFAPNWMVDLGRALEPMVERLPLARSLLCGQVGVLASGPGPS